MDRMLLAFRLSQIFADAYEAAGHLDDVINVHGFRKSRMLDYLDGFVVFACD